MLTRKKTMRFQQIQRQLYILTSPHHLLPCLLSADPNRSLPLCQLTQHPFLLHESLLQFHDRPLILTELLFHMLPHHLTWLVGHRSLCLLILTPIIITTTPIILIIIML